jgi:hypothetical protein
VTAPAHRSQSALIGAGISLILEQIAPRPCRVALDRCDDVISNQTAESSGVK